MVEHGNLHDLDLKQYQLGLVQFGREYKLTSSLWKTSYKDKIYPIHTKDFPLADKDAANKRIPILYQMKNSIKKYFYYGLRNIIFKLLIKILKIFFLLLGVFSDLK